MQNYFKLLPGDECIENFYHYLEFDKKKGFLLQIGVGNVIDYPGRDELLSRGIRHQPVEYTRLPSNTTELFERGWKGVCIDPVADRLIQCQMLHRERLQNLTLINHAASDRLDLVYSKFYKKHIRCHRTSNLLRNFCPKFMDLLDVSVGGMELKVLCGIDFRFFGFRMVIINISRLDPSKINEIMPSEYVELSRGDCFAIYLNKNL